MEEENARKGVDEESDRSGFEEDVCFGRGTELDIAEISAAVALNSSAAERDLRPFFLEEESSSFKRSTRLLTESSLSGLRTSCILEEEVGTGEDSDFALT